MKISILNVPICLIFILSLVACMSDSDVNQKSTSKDSNNEISKNTDGYWTETTGIVEFIDKENKYIFVKITSTNLPGTNGKNNRVGFYLKKIDQEIIGKSKVDEEVKITHSPAFELSDPGSGTATKVEF